MRKKLISEIIHFILVFYYAPTRLPQNRLNSTPLTSPPGRASCTIPPSSCLRVFGWLLCKFDVWRPPQATTYFILFILLSPNLPPQTTAKCPPHTLRCGCVSSQSLPPTTDTVFWLVVALFIDWGPRKAWGQPLYLFLDGLPFWCPRQPPAGNRTNQAYSASPIML